MKRLAVGLMLLGGMFATIGCEEEVAEIETPQGEVEVEENPDGTLETETD